MSAFAERGQLSAAFQINITPLVDVMLVLLVIFMLAVPLKTQRLPLADGPPCSLDCPAHATPVRLSIMATGEMYWNGAAVDRAALAASLVELASRHDPPALEVHVQQSGRYALLTDVLASAQNAGVSRIRVAAAEPQPASSRR